MAASPKNTGEQDSDGAADTGVRARYERGAAGEGGRAHAASSPSAAITFSVMLWQTHADRALEEAALLGPPWGNVSRAPLSRAAPS